MNTKNKSSSNLLQTIDQAKINIDPLPIHYLANNADVRTRELYASFLGSVMLSNGRVSDVEHRLFTMLLASLDIDTKVEPHLSNLETVELEELVKNLNSEDKKQVLLFDSLLLTRCNSPLSTEQVELISEICDLLSLEGDDLIYTLYWIGKLLGVEVKLKLENKKKYTNKIENFFRIRKILIKDSLFLKSNSILIEGDVNQVSMFSSALERNIKTDSSGFLLSITLDDKSLVINQRNINSLIDFNDDHYLENRLITVEIVTLPKYLENWQELIQELNK